VKSRIARGLAQLREILLSDSGAKLIGEKAPAQTIPPRIASKPEKDYDEWDFSSTRVTELFRAA